MLRLALVDHVGGGEPYLRIAPRLRHTRFTAVVRSSDALRGEPVLVHSAAASVAGFEPLLSEHSTEFDAVLFLPGNQFDVGHCRQAAAAGKHVLCDCPVGVTSELAATALTAAREAGVLLTIGYALRSSPAMRTIKESLDAGKLGVPGLLRIHRWCSCDTNVSTLQDQMIREIDLACWLFGRKPTTVFAVGRAVSGNDLTPSSVPRHDFVQVHLGFPEGGMAVLDWAATLPTGDGYLSISLIGSTGAAYADDHHNRQLVFDGGHPTALRTGEGDAARLSQVQEFVETVAGGIPPTNAAVDVLTALDVAESAARSLAAGQAVSLAEGA